MRICIAATSALATALSLCGQAQSELQKQLDAAVRAHLQPGFFGTVLVERDGRTILRSGYGFADRKRKLTTPETMFDVASISKQFTAAAILTLAEAGRLELHNSIAKYLPGVKGDKLEITVHHLLSHTAGLRISFDFSPVERADRDQMLRRTLTEPLEFPVGERFAYSNVGYCLLAVIIEKVSHRSFERYLQQRIFKPAAMMSTGFIKDTRLDPERSAVRWQNPGDEKFGDTAVNWTWHWAFKGATGTISCVDDLARWSRALADDRVLGPAMREKLLRPTVADYAYGLEVKRTPHGTTRQSHTGQTYGFRSRFVRLPEENALVVILSNHRASLGDIEEDIMQILASAGPEPDVLASCTGTYALPCGDRFEIVVEGVSLVVRPSGREATSRFLHGKRSAHEDPLNSHAHARHTLAIISQLTARNEQKLRQHFGSDTRTFAAARAIEHFATLTRELGRYRRTVYLGSKKAEDSTYVQLWFGKTATLWCATWNVARQLQALEPVDTVYPFSAPLSWRHGRKFHLKSADGWADIILEFDGKARSQRLLWHDRDNQEPLTCKRSRS